jgi:group I intron endonuclease
MGTIYVLRNRVNGKCYVGQTINTLRQRFAEHVYSGNKRHSLIGQAILKYGKPAFVSCEYHVPMNLLDDFERALIKRLNSIAPAGYNIEGGGGKKSSPETCAKRTIALRLYWEKRRSA